jgi:cyclic-di-GMP-binding protein
VLGALQHLALIWAAAPLARSSDRRLVTGRITVVPGFIDAMQALDPSTSDELDFSHDEPAESWIVVNVSDGGYGAIIPALKSDWIRVGTLIGMQSEHSSRWMIGLIRRIASDEHNQRHVGIQTLSKTAIPIRVVRAGTTNSSFDAGREPQPAILLSTAPDAQGEVGIIMREGIFSVRDGLEMMIGGKSYFLQPVRLVEGGEDFDWATFKISQQRA